MYLSTAGVHSIQVPQSGAHADNFTLSDKTAKSSKRKSDKDTDWNLQVRKVWNLTLAAHQIC